MGKPPHAWIKTHPWSGKGRVRQLQWKPRLGRQLARAWGYVFDGRGVLHIDFLHQCVSSSVRRITATFWMRSQDMCHTHTHFNIWNRCVGYHWNTLPIALTYGPAIFIFLDHSKKPWEGEGFSEVSKLSMTSLLRICSTDTCLYKYTKLFPSVSYINSPNFDGPLRTPSETIEKVLFSKTLSTGNQ